LLAGSQPETDEQVGFAGAGVTERDDRLAGVDPRAGCQGCELSGDAGDDVGVEVGQPLEAGEAGFADAAGSAPAGPVVGFGGQDLGQKGQVGLAFPDGDLGEPDGVGTDGRQLELTSRGADGCECRGIGQAGHREPPDSSWS
jgi:hypothetical protein